MNTGTWQLISTLFPHGVICVEAEPADWLGGLTSQEATYVESAVPKRIREFTAGRNCARRALTHLGISGAAILRGPNREPIWPKGVCGSISHSNDRAGAVVSRVGNIRSVGFDVESDSKLDEGLIRLICTKQEIQAVQKNGLLHGGRDPNKLLFSAKESVFKACFPVTGELHDFLDVSLTLQPSNQTFSAQRALGDAALAEGYILHGRYAFDGQSVLTGAWLQPSGASNPKL